MSSVDDRIVNMKFENTQFKTGAAESSKALTDLDKVIANTGKGGGLNQMGTAVDGIKGKFSALQVAGVAALGTIVAKATSAGLGLLKSFTIDPILDGFSEYQTNLNSVQTVMSNTGKSVDVVNAALQQLNNYSDQTIYNFSEMAKNVGTFTAAGVDLQTATASIQGIANLAALSGSSSAQASTAMYQLSQAIAAGRVSLQDWNSVVNAGMGGKIFQNALAQTSVAMGELDSNAVEVTNKVTIMGESFREAIGGGDSFLTGESLTNTLAALDGRFSRTALAANGYNTVLEQNAQLEKARQDLAKKGVKYSDEQYKALLKTAEAAYSAATTVKSFPQLMQVVKESIGSVFANSFSLILGDFEQSKKLWTSVGKVIVGPNGIITKMGASWTGLLRDFVDTGGRTKVLSGLGRIFRNLGKVMGALKGAFQEIFPPAGEKALTNIAKAFNRFTRNFVLQKDTVENLKNTFAGFFAVLHIGFSIIGAVAKVIFSLFGAITKGSGQAGGGLLSFTGGIGQALVALDKFLTGAGGFTDKISKLGGSIDNLIGPVVVGFQLIQQAISALAGGASLDQVTKGIKLALGTAAQFGGPAAVLQDFVHTVIDGFDKARPYILQVGTALQFAGDKIKQFTESGSTVGNILGKIISTAGNLASKAADLGTNIIAGIVAGITGSSFASVQAAIVGLAQSIIDWFKGALGIHSPAAEMIPLGVNVSEGVAQGIVDGLSKIGSAISGAAHFLKEAFLQLFGGFDAIDFATLMNQLFSGALLLALTNFVTDSKGTFGSFKDIFKSGIISTFKELGETLEAFQQGIKAKALLDIALAVGVLVASIVVLSFIKPEKIAISLGAIATMMGLLVGTLSALTKFAKGGVDLALFAVAMTLISASMIQLAIAVALFGNMDIGTLAKGFGSIAVALGLLVAASFGFSKIKGSIEGMAGSLLVIAFALNILAAAILAFGNMDIGTLAKGFGAMAVGLGLMAGAMLILDKMKSSPEGLAASLLVMAGAILVLSISVAAFGNMDMGTLAKGFGALAVGLLLMVGSLLILGEAGPQVLVAAAAMLLISTALIGLATAIGLFGNMDVGTLAKGFVAMAVGLALIIAAGAAAELVAPGLLTLGIAVGLLGAGMFLAGAGMLAFATGLTVLVGVGAAGIGIMIVAFNAFLGLLPTFAIQIAAAFVSFLETIAKAAPRVRAAMDVIFKNMIGVVTDNIPVIGKLFSQLLTTIIGIVRKGIPQYIEMGLTIVDKFIAGLAKHIPQVADSALQMILSFLSVLDDKLPQIIQKGTDLVIHLIQGIGKAASRIVTAAGETILDFLHALDAAVQQYSGQFRAVGISIVGHIIDAMSFGLLGKMQSVIDSAASHIHLPHIDLNPLSKKANFSDVAASSVAAALGEANKLVARDPKTGKIDQNVLNAANAASQSAALSTAAQNRADLQQKLADQAQKKADQAQKIADKKKATKAQKDAATAAQNRANKAKKAATKAANATAAAQKKADNDAANLQLAQTLRDSDNSGKADALSDRASELAAQANDALKKSQDEAALAADMKKKNQKGWKEILAQSQKDAATAAALAKQANDASAQANAFYAAARVEAQAAVTARLTSIRDSIEADIQARKDAAAYEAADDQGKLVIQQQRLAAAEKKRDDARAAAAAALADAQAKNAAGDTEGANLALDEAEKQAQIASTAADAADTAAQAIKDLQNQINGGDGTTGGTSGGSITPSRSVLEDAASAVDRYTASLAAASEAAAAAQTVITYNQTVNSPVALSPTEVYRQSKNLLSATQAGLVTTTGSPGTP